MFFSCYIVHCHRQYLSSVWGGVTEFIFNCFVVWCCLMSNLSRVTGWEMEMMFSPVSVCMADRLCQFQLAINKDDIHCNFSRTLGPTGYKRHFLCQNSYHCYQLHKILDRSMLEFFFSNLLFVAQSRRMKFLF